MMSFATSMSCDDICLWLRQKDVADDDVEVFKSTPACYLYLLCNCICTDTPCKYISDVFSASNVIVSCSESDERVTKRNTICIISTL